MALDIKTVDPTEYELSRIESKAMTSLRDLMQSHLSSLAVTASAFDPASFITDSMEAEYMALAMSLWEDVNALMDGFGLDVLPLSQYFPIVKDSIERSRNTFVEMFKALIGKQAGTTPTFGEFFFANDYVPGTGLKPPVAYEVQFGDVRPILGVLGGGAPPEVPLATGLTGGQTLHSVLSANNITTDQKMWLYGETVRRTFNGHLQMDGLVFTDWHDRALQISPQDRWIRSDYYRPGDHWGCACVVVPYIPNFGAPEPITITSSASSPVVESPVEMLSTDAEDLSATSEDMVALLMAEFYRRDEPRDKNGRWISGGHADAAWSAHKATLTPLSVQSIERSWGKGTEGVFGHSQTTTTTPWPRAPRSKNQKPIDRELIRRALEHPRIQSVDPRLLHATQPNLVRTHMDYYMGDNYRRTGRTSADHSSPTNAFPIVYVDKAGRHIILSGHHRAAAALAKGEPLPAVIVREP